MVLSDKIIRYFWVERLIKFKTFSIREEMRLIDNRAIADIVTLGKTIHCYEIKGESDSLSRLENQIQCYNQAFDKISIIATENNLHLIQPIVPHFWGIILAIRGSNRVKFRHLRRARINRQRDFRGILLTLWKSELASILKIYEPDFIEKNSKDKLLELVAKSIGNKQNLNLEFSKQLVLRNLNQVTVAA